MFSTLKVNVLSSVDVRASKGRLYEGIKMACLWIRILVVESLYSILFFFWLPQESGNS